MKLLLVGTFSSFLTGSTAFSLTTQRVAPPRQQLYTFTTTRLHLSSSDEPPTPTEEEETPTLPTAGSDDELLYALGMNLARQLGDVRPLVESGDELAQLAKGVLDTLIGRVSEPIQKDILVRRGEDLKELVGSRARKIQETMAQAGWNMLNEMEQTEGATKLPSGVILHVLSESTDSDASTVRPTKASSVKIHYHGTMADGTIFDSTLGGEPVVLPLAGVIPGWREAVLRMHEGQTAMVGIPPEHAYGETGTPDGRIPGNCPIFFKVQLLEVLSAGIGGAPTLLGADGKKLDTTTSRGGLLGADGKPLS